MPSRREKVAGHAEHLLDAFLRLRATYAILDPLLFDHALVARWKGGPAAYGRQILVNTLLYSCVLETSKLTLDQDPRTPSLHKLDESLADERLYGELREGYAIRDPNPEFDDPEVLKLLIEMERKDEEQRRVQFDELVQRFRTGWAQLRASQALSSFEVLRDKVIAHNEVRHENGRYQVFDVGSLGLKFGDLRTVVLELEPLVDLTTVVFRATSFAFDDFDQQLRDAAQQFWAVTRDG